LFRTALAFKPSKEYNFSITQNIELISPWHLTRQGGHKKKMRMKVRDCTYQNQKRRPTYQKPQESNNTMNKKFLSDTPRSECHINMVRG